MSSAPRRQFDWEAIEREYRAGQLSVAEIARQHGLSHTAINKRAKKDGWLRDLTERVRERVSAKLVSPEVSEANAEVAVETAAARGVEIVLRHRKDIARLRELREALTTKAEALAPEVATLSQLSDAVTTVESLSRTISRLVPLERQAFNLDSGDDPKAGDHEMDDRKRAKAIAALVARTVKARVP